MHESEATIVSSIEIERVEGNFLSSIAAAAVEIPLENLWHGNLNLYFLIVHRNGVAVVNVYGSILGDNEDHVDNIQHNGGLLIFVRHRAGKVSLFGFDLEIKS